MPRVSVVMTVFNEMATLERAFDSILSQPFQDLELIIVDNCSTDDSASICEKYSQVDSRVSLFRNKVNVGPIQNFHRCLWRATGEYVRLHSGNDHSELHELTELVATLDNDPTIGLAYATHVEPMSNYLDLIQENPKDRIRTLIQNFQSGHLVYGLIRRHIIDQCSPIPYRMSADQIYLAEIALYAKIKVCDTKSYNRMNHDRTTKTVAQLCSAVWPRMIEDPLPLSNEATVYPPYLDCLVGYGEMVDCARISPTLRKEVDQVIQIEFLKRWRSHLEREFSLLTDNIEGFLAIATKGDTEEIEHRYAARLLDATTRYATINVGDIRLTEATAELIAWLHGPKN